MYACAPSPLALAVLHLVLWKVTTIVAWALPLIRSCVRRANPRGMVKGDLSRLWDIALAVTVCTVVFLLLLPLILYLIGDDIHVDEKKEKVIISRIYVKSDREIKLCPDN